nr:PREDICTED: uncharacterized protein LOC105678256 [Linepithema humile]
MSVEERIQKFFPWVEECFIKTDNFRVQCRNLSCQSNEERYKYLEFKRHTFKNHIRDTHPDYHQHEEKMAKNKDWKCFRLTKDKKKACILCDIARKKFSQNENLSEHLKNHSKLEQNLGRDKNEAWYWKYLEQTEDYSAKCKLCTHKPKTDEFIINLEKMRKHILQHHKEKSRLINLQYKNTWEFQIENHYWLNKCYKRPKNFLAQCKFCEKKITYVKSESIEIHMEKEHPLLHKEEKLKFQACNTYWQHLRFTDGLLTGIQCMKCFLLIQSDEAEIHVQHHFTDGLEPGTRKHWTLKYARQNADSVTCVFCEKNLTLTAKITELKKHVQNCHIEDMNTIDKENLLWTQLIGEQWKWLEKYYMNVANFRAECKFCKHKVPYIEYTQFEQHMWDQHFVIACLEESKMIKIWKAEKYVRYTNNVTEHTLDVECIICEKNVALPHTKHSPYELLFDSHWALKYAIQNGQVASCVLCKDEVNFKWALENLENHMTSIHPEKRKQIRQIDLVQGTVHDQATPSTSYAS